MFNKRETDDGVTAEQVRNAVEQLLPALVAEQLPRLLAEQLAAMGMSEPAVQDTVPDMRSSPGKRNQEHTPSWTREAREAVADYENQLSSIDFDPEGSDTTSAKGH